MARRTEPTLLHEIRKTQHRQRRRLVVFGFLSLAVVAGGAAAFSIARRSAAPEPSTLPPSVDVAPKI
ncbi:cell wall synthesis protein CwsA [Mycolicibacterium sp. Dal123E01]|uniref:cell wall synthesis protein CwsA n=1 Tax=Mycolicibacterium sp. Dal123E01 TaxID=3457578 RepID=UPI00403EB91D